MFKIIFGAVSRTGDFRLFSLVKNDFSDKYARASNSPKWGKSQNGSSFPTSTRASNSAFKMANIVFSLFGMVKKGDCLEQCDIKFTLMFAILIKCDFLNMMFKICLRHKHDYAIMFTFLHFLNMRQSDDMASR